MIKTQLINVFTPESSQVKDPTAGYFSAVRLDDFSAESLAASSVYSRKDFYKISLVKGPTSYQYGDNKIDIDKKQWALVFTNCEIPYMWQNHAGKCIGFSCMFTENFLPLHTHMRPSDWGVFNNTTQSVFILKENEKDFFEHIFIKMIEEQASTYMYKYDLLFLYVLECIHAAIKLQPEPVLDKHTASSKLAAAFKALLANHFPLAYPHQELLLQTAPQYAEKLGVHTNYLNRVLKEITGKTTTQLITERFMQEAHALVIHSNWTISQIGHSLGYQEPTHFTRAFRKHTGHSPISLRSIVKTSF